MAEPRDSVDKSKVEVIVNAVCPTGGEHNAFLYVGIQEGYKELPDFVLYNCFGCRTTRSGRCLGD